MSQITCEQLYNLWMSEPQLILILDLRSLREFQEAHIPGAIRVEEHELEDALRELNGRLAVLVAPEGLQEFALPTEAREQYVFLRDCQGWKTLDLPLAGRAVQRILDDAQDPSQTVISQVFHEKASDSLSYVIADAASREAVLVDPTPCERRAYESLIHDMKLRIVFILQTHQHAAARREWQPWLRELGAAWAGSYVAPGSHFDLRLEDGQELLLGEQTLRVVETPGHTPCSMSYYVAGRVLTGDTLLVQSCGRPAEYPGAADDLYVSIHETLYRLPEETLVLPAHGRPGRLSSTIGFEKKCNEALPWLRTRAEFMQYLEAQRTVDKSEVESILKCRRT